MVDDAALKAKFAGYPHILAHIEMLIEENDQFTLRRLEVMRKNELNQTVSSGEWPGREIPLSEMEDFVRRLRSSMGRTEEW